MIMYLTQIYFFPVNFLACLREKGRIELCSLIFRSLTTMDEVCWVFPMLMPRALVKIDCMKERMYIITLANLKTMYLYEVSLTEL